MNKVNNASNEHFKKHIVILGGGIMGISTAHMLLNIPGKPYQVTIVSEFYSPSTVSDKSGLIN